MNEPKQECEKRENDACLREKRESWIRRKTQMWEMREKEDGAKDQSEKARLRAHETEWKKTRKGARDEWDRVSPSPGLLLLF